MTGDERGGIVTGWLLKIVVSLAVLGFSVFEAGSVIFAKVSVERIAKETAEGAALEYGRTSSSAKTQEVAERIAERQEAEVVGKIEVFRDLDQVRVTVRKTANTILLSRIGFLRDLTEHTATHNARIR